jgi:hypothetical protein
MPITGGIKFFEPNFADSKNNPTVTVSTGEPSADFIVDRNKYTYWRSVGSDDTTTEIIQIDLVAPLAINRVFLLDHNFKQYTVIYGSGPSDFTNVIGVNGVENPTEINETDYAFNSSYYEFDEVTTDRIIIGVTKTQVADQEKYLNSFVVTTELGTFQGYPNANATKDKKLRKSILLNGRSNIDKSLEVTRFKIDFKNYPPPTPYADDLDLTYSLFDRDDNFLVWLCGGRAGDPYFKYQLRGWRLEDLIEVQTVNVFKDSYRKNYYNGPVRLKMNLEEAG